MHHKHAPRLCTMLATAAAALALPACSVSGFGDSPLPFEDDFSGPCDWPEDDDADSKVGCAGDAYEIDLRQEKTQIVALDLDANVRAIHVEADADLVRGATPPLEPGESIAFGVGCWLGEDLGYVFVVWADGTFSIARDERNTDELVTLATGSGSSERVTNGRVSADCVSGTGTTALVLSLDGNAVLTARDERSHGPFDAIGFVLLSSRDGVEGRFDNVAARELTENEIAAIERRPVNEHSTLALPLEDDFSNRGSGWATGTDELVTLEYAGDAYRMQLNGVEPQWSLFELGRSVEGLALETTARMEAGPSSTTFGVVCYSGQEDGYILAVSAAGGYEIIREDPERFRVVKEGTAPDVVRPGQPVHLDASCVDSNGGARLTLAANGSEIAMAQDREWQGPFDTVGFLLSAQEPGAAVLFDDFAARELP